MPCYYPQPAFRSAQGVRFVAKGQLSNLTLPCGQCIGCRLARSRQWAARCMHEASLHRFNSFITLTYSSEFLPFDFGLHYRDFQLFMKRLRCGVSHSVRFYMCGEYGDVSYRPHFHACLFNTFFCDRQLISESAGVRLYRSRQLDRLWPFGFASVGDVTFESAAYVARYCAKKVNGSASSDHYRRVDSETGECFDVAPEFSHMSLKPAIGLDWLRLYYPEVLAHRGLLVSRGGVKSGLPRYYHDYLCNLSAWDSIALDREIAQRERARDNTPERLRVREDVERARLRLKSRSL